MHGNFPNKLTRKIHTEIGLSAVQTSEPMSKRQEAIPFLFCCYVTYCIMYRIMTTVLGYISYHAKMYCCRPTNYVIATLYHICVGRLPYCVQPVSDPKEGDWDGVVLVCENLDWSCDKLDFLKEPIQDAAKVCARSIFWGDSL